MGESRRQRDARIIAQGMAKETERIIRESLERKRALEREEARRKAEAEAEEGE